MRIVTTHRWVPVLTIRGVKRIKVRFNAAGGDVHLEDVLVHADLNE